MLALCVIEATPALAQIDRRIPRVAFDARAFTTGLSEDAITAADLGIVVELLPTRANRPGRRRARVHRPRRARSRSALAREWLLGRGKKQESDAEGDPVGEPVERRLQSFSPQVSLNFGQRDGWSYVSAGMGPMTYETFVGELPPVDGAAAPGHAQLWRRRSLVLRQPPRVLLRRALLPDEGRGPNRRHSRPCERAAAGALWGNCLQVTQTPAPQSGAARGVGVGPHATKRS